MIERVLGAADRFTSRHNGIETWHCFSAGAHYDPDTVSFGPLIGVDEHRLAPGAAFDWHTHAGVDIVSVVVSGTLRHEDDAGNDVEMGPGEVLVQHAGEAIRHRESNGGADELCLLQLTILTDRPGRSLVGPAGPRWDAGAASGSVWRESRTLDAPSWHLFAMSGRWTLDGGTELRAGDSARGHGKITARAGEAGELLAVALEHRPEQA